MIVTISAIIFVILSGILILFQLGLTIGMPWGEASMGGKFPGKYPPKMRVVSLINSFVLSFMAVIVLIKSEVLFPQFRSFANVAIYFVVAFSAITAILNIITPSKIERKLWAPVAILLLTSSCIVAFVSA
jgi:hypothetical protein